MPTGTKAICFGVDIKCNWVVVTLDSSAPDHFCTVT
jgi:hypothetical protein